jgi:hypothetical protein
MPLAKVYKKHLTIPETPCSSCKEGDDCPGRNHDITGDIFYPSLVETCIHLSQDWINANVKLPELTPELVTSVYGWMLDVGITVDKTKIDRLIPKAEVYRVVGLATGLTPEQARVLHSIYGMQTLVTYETLQKVNLSGYDSSRLWNISGYVNMVFRSVVHKITNMPVATINGIDQLSTMGMHELYWNHDYIIMVWDRNGF